MKEIAILRNLLGFLCLFYGGVGCLKASDLGLPFDAQVNYYRVISDLEKLINRLDQADVFDPLGLNEINQAAHVQAGHKQPENAETKANCLYKEEELKDQEQALAERKPAQDAQPPAFDLFQEKPPAFALFEEPWFQEQGAPRVCSF